MKQPRLVRVAWAAGVLEGEGSFCIKTRRKAPVATCHMTDLDVLQGLQEVFDGHIWGSNRRAKSHYKQTWVWSTSTGEHAAQVMREIRPFMMQRRGEQIDACLLAWDQTVQERTAAHRERVLRNEEMLRLKAAGLSGAEIGRRFGVSRETVSGVLTGRTYTPLIRSV